jgi:hypothetical protein
MPWRFEFMSTLSGGPADKAGNFHEALWGVVGMVSVLGEQADAIRIEEPGTDGAEFYLDKAGNHEHWQAKRQMLNQKTWSLQLLKNEGILDFFRKRADAGESCVFASISDAPELRGLAENAREAQDWNEFQKKFLATDRWREHFNELKKHLGYRARADVFEFLRKARIEGGRESTLEALLLPVFKASFMGAPQTVLAILRDLYAASVHRKLTAEDILTHLDSHGLKRRTLAVSAELRDFVQGITAAYVAGQQTKLIRGESIPRQACANIVQRIRDSKCSLDILITASAGGGKSADLLQVVTGLGAAGIPVLAFRLDRIEPVASTEALGHELDLPESPAVVLSQCYPNQAVALVIDQLDFVSAASGRHPDFFEVVAALADEVRGLRESRQLHLITACRQFDFQNDSRIRRLIAPTESPIAIGLLSEGEVRNVIVAEGGDPAHVSAKQIELLRLPQNLALFVDSGLAKEREPGFVTQTQLLDAYWNAKRRAVSLRRPDDSGQWTNTIAKLIDEMNNRQELSVPKARLDEFSPEFLAAMASEGVLSFDGQRYGFGHESLFDYCFARRVAARETEFVEFLEADRQELFRRAQLRQVLVYLRDDDLPRYLGNVERALASEKIRPHLKLLVLELLAAFSDPREEELALLMPLLESELDCRSNGIPNPNKIATLAWGAFFMSGSLFVLADKLGNIALWLHSGEESLENQMTFYLRSQARFHADRVAELLEPFVGRGGRWNERLRFIMEWADLGVSRRLFDMFLRLLDDGTLDDARGPIAVNSTFWSLLHDLGAKRPAWCAEAGAHWLDRKVAIAKASADEGNGPNLEDQFGVEAVLTSARGAPNDFLQHVLSAMLRSAEAFVFDAANDLRSDRIWSIRFAGGYLGLSEAFLRGCEIAFESLGGSDPEKLRPFIETLRTSRLCIANQLLQSACISAPELYAEEAITLLADEPARLHCGFSGSPFWTARTLLRKCSPYCSNETFQRIETMLLGYKTEYESSREGFRHQGYSAYTLASALEPGRCHENTKRRLAEWQRKFGPLDEQPRGIEGGFVGPPISEEAAKHMTDEQWLRAIETHDTESGVRDWNRPLRGGAHQLATVLREHVKKEPERFARLALQFPEESNGSYFMNVLYGLKEVTIDSNLKIAVARRVFASDDVAFLMAALDLLASAEDMPLPDDAVQFVQGMATEHPDPDAADNEREDLLQQGINTVRGRGVEAIRDLVFKDAAYLDVFRNAIEHCVRDPSLAVRACAASTILAVAVHDKQWAIALFKQLLEADDRLLSSHYVEDFLARGLRAHVEDLRPVIERMLRSEIEKVRQAGGRLACLARLYHPQLEELAEAAIAGDPACRFGATEVASQNLAHPDCRAWCEATLKRFFNDEDQNVRRHAAGCFWHLWQQPELPLGDYNALIRSFLDSRAFAEEPTYLLHALDDTRQRVPETILDVCDMFVAKCAEAARDISTSMAGDETTVGKLVFRAYAQLEAQPLRQRALGLIDKMCSEGLQSAGKHLTEFER